MLLQIDIHILMVIFTLIRWPFSAGPRECTASWHSNFMHNKHQLAIIIMAIMAMYVAGVVLVTMSVAMSYSEYL